MSENIGEEVKMVGVSRILLVTWVLVSFGFLTMGYASIEDNVPPPAHPHKVSLPLK